MEHLFEPVKRDGMSPRSEDRGLGLAVAKTLVEAHGGSIEVKPGKSKGNVFCLRLPFDESMQRPPAFNVKRKHRRARVSLLVEFQMEGMPAISSEISTLGLGGCFIIVPAPQPFELPHVHHPLTIKINYFGDELLSIPHARVANVSWAGSKSGIGVEFLSLDPKTRKILSAIVKSHTY